MLYHRFTGWEAWVANLTAAGKNGNPLHKGAIYTQGGVKCGCNGLTIKPTEVTAIVAGFANPDKIRADGAFVNGEKYLIIRADDQVIYAKKGTSGFAAAKTNGLVVLGTYADKMQPGACNNRVETIAGQLKDANQ